jgi:hypothetical protein
MKIPLFSRNPPIYAINSDDDLSLLGADAEDSTPDCQWPLPLPLSTGHCHPFFFFLDFEEVFLEAFWVFFRVFLGFFWCVFVRFCEKLSEKLRENGRKMIKID